MISFKDEIVKQALDNYTLLFTESNLRLQEVLGTLKAKKRRRLSHWCFLVPISDFNYYKNNNYGLDWSEAKTVWIHSRLLSTHDYLVLEQLDVSGEVAEIFSVSNRELTLYTEEQVDFITEYSKGETDVRVGS